MSKHLKYFYLATGLLSGMLVILGLFGTLYLQSSGFQQLLLRHINQIIPGQVDWEDMDLSLPAGEIRLQGITLKRADKEILAELPSLEVNIDWSGFLKREVLITSVLVTSPRINLGISEQGNVNLINALVPQQDPGSESEDQGIPLNLVIRECKILDGELTMTIPDYAITVPDLNLKIADLNLASLSASVETDLRGCRIKYGDTALELASLELNGRIERDMVSDLKLLAKTKGMTLEAKGKILEIIKDPFLDITADIRVDTKTAAQRFDVNADGTGKLSLAVKGTINNPKASLTAIHGPGQVEGHPISALSLSAGLADRILTLRSSELELNTGKLILTGAVNLQKLFPLGFIEEMSALENLSYDLTARQEGFPLSGIPVENLEGSLSSIVSITGQGIAAARITAEITAAGVKYPPMQYPAEIKIQSSANLSEEQLNITAFKINGPGISGSGNGQLNLKGFNPDTAQMTGSLNLEAADLSIPAGLLGYTATGQGTLSTRAEGPLLSPEVVLEVDAGDLAIQGGHADLVSARMRLDSNGLHIDEALVREQEGLLRAKGRVGTEKDPVLNLEVLLEAIGLTDLLPGQGIDGTLEGTVSVGGTIATPLVTASINGNSIVKDDIPIGDIRTDFRLTKDVLSINRADVIHKNQRLTIGGQVGLTDRTVDIRLTAEDLDLAKLPKTEDIAGGRISLDITAAGALEAPELNGRLSIRDAGGDMGVSGDLEADFHSQGPLAHLSRISATANITRLAISRDGQTLLRVQNTTATMKEGRINLEDTPVHILSQGRLTLSGQADLNGDLDAEASGTIPLALAVPLLDGIRSATGDIKISLTAKGDLQQPKIEGILSFDDLGLELEQLEQPIRKVTGLIRFTSEAIEIERLAGNLDQGLFQTSGKAELKGASLGKFSLGLTAHQLPLDIPETLSLTLNSSLKLSGTPEESDLTGSITLLEGRYYRDIDLNLIDLTTRRTRKVKAAESGFGPSFLKTIALNIHVGRRDPLLVDNNLAYMTVSPDLMVRGTAHTPVLAGRAQVDEGVISFQRARFEVTKGTIDFINPYRIEPDIELNAETTIRSWDITLSISGSPEDLDLSFSSDPSETDADILSLIAFGKTTQEMGTAQGGGNMVSAGMAAGLVAEPLTETLKDATGLDEVEISMEDTDGTTGIHVSLGADLSRQLSVSYGVDIRDGETVQRVTTYYKILEHLLMSGFQDTGGRFGGELKYRLEFR